MSSAVPQTETAMPRWVTAVPDWEKRLLAGRSLVPDLPLFPETRDKALRVFKRLKLPDVRGTPTMGEAAGEWFFAIVAALFGSFNPKTNVRMIQEYFLLVPKKNGKSSYAAAIMVTAIIVNTRPEAEFLLIAPTKKIADISFKQASGIIKADPELRKLFLIQRHIRTISHRTTGATILIQAADTDVITGSKSTGILIDEIHEFAKKSKAADVFVEIRGALAARPDGFMLQISTQSKDPPKGVFEAELQNARDVRDGKLALPRLAVIYELPKRLAQDNGWQNEKYWPLVNPNWELSVNPQFLRDQLVTAKREGVAKLAIIASQHFNVEIGQGLSTDSWAGAEFFQKNIDKSLLKLETLIKCSEVAVIGIDGGGLDDLLGLAVLGRDKVTRDWLLWSHAWAHQIVFERRKDIAVELKGFEKDGHLTIVQSPGDDVEDVANLVMKIEKAGLLPEKAAIGVDAVGIGDIVNALTAPDRGFELERIIGISQGWKLNGAIKTAERRLAGGELLHGGMPLMTWAVGNAKVEAKGNAISITKQTAGSAKIDPLMALFDAVSLMALNPEASRRGKGRALLL